MVRQSSTEAKRRRRIAPRDYLALAALTLAFWGICLAMGRLTDSTLFGPSVYNSYSLQAMAWREGRVALGVDHPHLELAVYGGDWYVSFPPLPSVPLYFLTFLFGLNTPDAFLVKLYGSIAVASAWALLVRRGWNAWVAAFVALCLGAGGSALPLMLEGAVWYQAQTLALATTMLAVLLMASGRVTPGLVCYALAVGCRPFNVCYGPLIILLWMISYARKHGRDLRRMARSLTPGVLMGLAVAAGYAAYNFARFGNPLEFGHNYLPEFTRSANGQFSLTYLKENASRFLVGLPVKWAEGGWQFEKFGSSVFLANPLLLALALRYVVDLLCRRARTRENLVMLFFAAHLFLLLLHRTGGGFQMGARYAVDLTPYALIYFALHRGRARLNWWEWAILLALWPLTIAGTLAVHI